jgi:hypothetical protein
LSTPALGWEVSRQHLFGLSSKSSRLRGMSYIVQRRDRFYVVAYDGPDPLTGKE